MPHIMGSDAAGIVDQVAADVQHVKPGDEVVVNTGFTTEDSDAVRRGEPGEAPDFGILGFMRPGTYAEKVAVPAANLRPRPAHLSWEAAAAFPLAYLTAYRMLFTRARLQPGETVLIHGVGGGVALAGLQLACHAGAHVIVTSSSDSKLQRAAELGAHHGINYNRTDDVAASVLEQTGDRGVDVAFDTVGAATWPINLAAVRKGGRIVHCGITTGPDVNANISAIYWNQLSILGSTMGSHEDFRRLVETVAATRLQPVIDSVYDLAEAQQATEKMERGEQFGKIVLRVA
jgi:NADPH:quinone reductase-like Zn-dependent oxidoreductase